VSLRTVCLIPNDISAYHTATWFCFTKTKNTTYAWPPVGIWEISIVNRL